MLGVDDRVRSMPFWAFRWLYRGGMDGSQAVLATIAGSMITVAGVTFSVVIVAFTLASTQFGPRILLTFMRDLGNQVVLGTFIATFVYCLVVLWTTGGSDHPSDIPALSVALAVGMALASLGVLIYFVHHAAASIQAPNIVAEVGRDLDAAIGRFFTGEMQTGSASPAPAAVLPECFEEEARPLPAAASGYLQAVDEAGLMAVARQRDVVLRLNFRPGDFVTCGSALAHGWPPERTDSVVAAEVEVAFLLGNQRTPAQDVGFVVNQLVEVAVRALSPGHQRPVHRHDLHRLAGGGAGAHRRVAGAAPLPARRGGAPPPGAAPHDLRPRHGLRLRAHPRVRLRNPADRPAHAADDPDGGGARLPRRGPRGAAAPGAAHRGGVARGGAPHVGARGRTGALRGGAGSALARAGTRRRNAPCRRAGQRRLTVDEESG
jgi:hypothetical protein